MKGTLLDSARTIGDQYGVHKLDLPTEHADGDVRKGIYSSYNTFVSNSARNSSCRGCMIDERMKPPEGFRLFYKGNDSGVNIYSLEIGAGDGTAESLFDGVLQVWCGDWSFTGRVPVRMDATKYPVSVNMLDVIRKSGQTYSNQISFFLESFDFHTFFNSETYQNMHARKLP